MDGLAPRFIVMRRLGTFPDPLQLYSDEGSGDHTVSLQGRGESQQGGAASLVSLLTPMRCAGQRCNISTRTLCTLYPWEAGLPFFFGCFRAALAAYGSSQARGQNWSCSHQPRPQPQQLQIRAESATYTRTHGNAGSLTCWARPGMEPASSWMLVRFVSAEP